MRIANDSIIRTSGSVNIPFESLPIYVGSSFGYSVQITHTTTMATFKLQCSSDAGKPISESWTADDVSNWTDITDSIVMVAESGDITWDVSDLSYRWIRLVATGVGTIDTARFNLKGA